MNICIFLQVLLNIKFIFRNCVKLWRKNDDNKNVKGLFFVFCLIDTIM